MPSFDIVSEVDLHELSNAVDQANREVQTRFDFKGSDAHFGLENQQIELQAQNDFQIKQMQDILHAKLAKREVDSRCLEEGAIETANMRARLKITVKAGLETDAAKKITKLLKDSKLKVKGQIMDQKIRVTGKKRDDLQETISFVKQAKLDMPLQFNNFRD